MAQEILPTIQVEELVEELVEAIGWLADGLSSPNELRRTVVALEARKLARFGLTLTSAVSPDFTVHFSLRQTGTGELCASLDFDPKTGRIVVQPAWL